MELLETAREGLDSILKDARSIDKPDRILVRMFLRKCDIELSLGNTEQAIQDVDSGYLIAKNLREANVNDLVANIDLASCVAKQLELMLRLGKTAQAAELSRQCFAIWNRYERSVPEIFDGCRSWQRATFGWATCRDLRVMSERP